MSEPITKTPAVEAERRKSYEDMLEHVNDTTNYRIKQAEILADIKAELRYGQLWMQTHDLQDKEEFRQLRAGLGGVSSGVNDYKSVKDQVIGARRLVVGAAVVVGACYGVFEAVLKIIGALKP